MKMNKAHFKDYDLEQVGAALKRAAIRARRLAERTGTPFYVMRNERIVDLNPQSPAPGVLREESKQADGAGEND